MAKVQANYSGEWPSRCQGEWSLIIDGTDVSDKIPSDIRRNHHMNTYGTYERRFLGRRGTRCETYSDGLEYKDWKEDNKEWLIQISANKSIWEDIYDAINKEDWRHGSCGGCI